MKPVIYLDVDGVLNALGHENDTWGDFELHKSVVPDDIPFGEMGFDLWLSKEMIKELASLPADVVWLTTWRHDAPSKVAPLVDAPDWPVIDWRLSKWDALAQDQRNNPRPFVWVDDGEATELNMNRIRSHVGKIPYLLIQPNSLIGLTPKDIDDIKVFLDWLEEISQPTGFGGW